MLARSDAECRCDTVILHVRLGGGSDPEAARRCIRRLGAEVIPKLR